eukprot:NODE_1546_length_1465_cov_63.215994_g1466_i0.p1 GENE.NODE_1546_length_1465_cov_63.215994_g1466_i0~~NODE_1546_length_1465_cov_63.215994_g1466_i0.p1  ORF type:complete len:458 (-),score=111.46 NODE_1546_length_1465_cov_63.215994_g1466_i0:92-1405(-)
MGALCGRGSREYTPEQVEIYRSLRRFVRREPDPGLALEVPTEYAWRTPPLESIILEEYGFLKGNIVICEPYRGVGDVVEPDGTMFKNIRPSVSVGQMLYTITGHKPVCLPIWVIGCNDYMADYLVGTACVVFEGGIMDPWDVGSFCFGFTWTSYVNLLENVLLQRLHRPTTGVFLGMSHQMVYVSLLRLLRAFIEEVGTDANAPSKLKEWATNTQTMGQSLEVKKNGEEVIARGYEEKFFVVYPNKPEHPEGLKRLCAYTSSVTGLPPSLLQAHLAVHQRYSTILPDLVEQTEPHITTLFHNDVSEESVLFLNWALVELRKLLEGDTGRVLRGHLEYAFSMPCGVEILASQVEPATGLVSAVGATALYFQHIRSEAVSCHFTCNNQPETLDFGGQQRYQLGSAGGTIPTYATLQRDPGARMLAKMLVAGSRSWQTEP